MSDIDLDAIQARADAATESPWFLIGGNEYVVGIDIGVGCDDGGIRLRDAEFVAHARTDVPALIAAVRDRDATIARVRAVLDCDHLPRPVNDWDRGWDRAIAEVRAAMDQQELT